MASETGSQRVHDVPTIPAMGLMSLAEGSDASQFPLLRARRVDSVPYLRRRGRERNLMGVGDLIRAPWLSL
jgi:hypothetical protein